jgi:hypothetical protein
MLSMLERPTVSMLTVIQFSELPAPRHLGLISTCPLNSPFVNHFRASRSFFTVASGLHSLVSDVAALFQRPNN